MHRLDRAVTPVISTILMVAIVVILAATISVFVLDFGEEISDPAPNVADTTGEFAVTPPGERAGSKQIVQITHTAGEGVAVEELEIVVRASGPDDDLPTEARLVDLPGETSTLFGNNIIDAKHLQGDDDLIDNRGPWQTVTEDDTNTWSAGQTIQFRISTTNGADFREEPNGPEADELEVIIIHTPSNTIISENTFRP